MDSDRKKEQAVMWRDSELGNLEVLRATYITHTFARHAHETFALGLIEAGVGGFQTRRGTHVAHASNIFIIHPDEVHNGYAVSKMGCTYCVIYPGSALLQQIASEGRTFTHSTPFFSQTIISDDRLKYLLLSLHHLLEQPSDRLERETYLQWTCAHLLTHHATHTLPIRNTGQEHRAVAQIRDYLHAHICENISLQILTEKVGLHPSYLVRVFHAHVGLPPHAYLTQIRVQQAKALLLQDVSLPQVALATGFADQSHLTRHFRHLVGVTPGTYAHHVKNVLYARN